MCLLVHKLPERSETQAQPSRISSAASPAQRSRISCLTSHPGSHLQRCQQRCRSALSATCSWTKIRGERMLLGLNVDIRRLRTGAIFLAASSSVFADRVAVRVWVRASYRLRRRGGSALRGVWWSLRYIRRRGVLSSTPI